MISCVDGMQDARAQSEEPGASSAALEGPVLMAINVERTQQGLDSAHKLTVQLLKAHLRGKIIGGQEWKAGNKKKEDLMYDYRYGLLVLRQNTKPLHAMVSRASHCQAPVPNATSSSGLRFKAFGD